MSKVMVFGVFDFLHEGHINFLKHARKKGAYLVASVARDANVFEAKGHLPVFPERERLSRLSRSEFVDEAVLGGLHNPWTHITEERPDLIVLGYDQRAYLAKDSKTLQKELKNRGLDTKVVRLKKYGNSKTHKFKKVTGIVQKNIGRGKRLGFPTANIKLKRDLPEGVYLAYTVIASPQRAKQYGIPSLAFIGKAETFGETEKKLEVYILDYNEDLYGKKIEVELVRKIRDNKKFGSAKSLIHQMRKDERFAKRFFHN